MAFPPTIGTGSTGEFPVEKPRREPPGSSIVNLIPEANPDERPTIIGGPRPVQPMELVAGQKLGHFELLDAIGRGGMATVIKARDLELARIVALKILPPETARDPEVVSRFKQEARAAAMLDHENIARVYFCGEDRGLQFIAFEFVAGDNLRVVIERDGRLSPATAVRYMLQVATGLMHAAQRGVVHRDIKPSNIIITPDGQAKIVDMGLARLFDSVAVNGGVTQSGVTLGTFDYISPEQALDPRRADLRSDIYSLGCTFYHALTGQPPVPEGTAAKKLHAHQYDSPLDPRDLNPAVPEALAAVLAKMMAKDPARRYATAEELIADLQAVSMQCGFTLEMPPLEGAMQRPVPTLSEPNLKLPLPWLLAGSAAVIALAILFGRPSANAPTAPPWGETASSKSLPIENAPAANAAVPGNPANKAILTVPQFADALKAGDAVTLKLRPGTTFDFAALSEALTFSGSSLTIEAESGGTPPVLKLDVDRGLIFRGCRQVTLRGLDFQAQSAEEPGTEVRSAVECDGVNRISILGCRWHANVRGIAGAKIHSESACEVIVQNSLFDLGSGSTAFLLAATAKAEFRDSAFAAHQAAIEILPGEAEAAAGEVKLANCTFLLDRGAAIRASADTPVKISAEFCLFAAGEAKAPDVIMPGDLRPAKGVVLQLDGGATPEARFAAADHPNGYFEVAPLVLDGKAYSFADCPATIFNDAAARLLTRLPWAVSDPRPLVNGSDPAVAFRLNLSDARLRLPPASAAVILGAKVLGNAETHIYPGAWPPERAQAVKAAGNERIVWPEAEAEDAALRLYPNFAAAYAVLQPGETLSLAVNGPVPVPPLPEKALRGTIRASAGFKPVLVPEGAAFTTDAMLFRLAEGDLTFDGLEICAQGSPGDRERGRRRDLHLSPLRADRSREGGCPRRRGGLPRSGAGDEGRAGDGRAAAGALCGHDHPRRRAGHLGAGGPQLRRELRQRGRGTR